MTVQVITEATANKLIESMHDLQVAVAVFTEKLEVQGRLNQSQEETNKLVSKTLLEIAKGDVARDKRLDALEAYKNWISGVLTAVLVVVLIAVAVAALSMAYGGSP